MTDGRAPVDGGPVTGEAARRRIEAELDRNLRALVDEWAPVPGGWVARTRSLPLVWTLNRLTISEPMSFEDLVSLADEHQSDLSFRQLVVEGATAAPGLADAFGAAGWKVEREVMMALGPGQGRHVDGSTVREIDEARMLELMRMWWSEEHSDITADGLDQLARFAANEGRSWSETCFGILDRDGRAVALTKLRVGDDIAWVEDVYTAPDARRQGYARSLVTHATELAHARAPFAFILADDNDRPKRLYADIGFQPVGVNHQFHLEVGAPA